MESDILILRFLERVDCSILKIIRKTNVMIFGSILDFSVELSFMSNNHISFYRHNLFGDSPLCQVYLLIMITIHALIGSVGACHDKSVFWFHT